jgi:hypothetical protein
MCLRSHVNKIYGRSVCIYFLFLSAKPEIVVPGSGIRFRYFIFEISGEPSFVEAVFRNYDELRSFSTFFALNFDKKLAVK